MESLTRTLATLIRQLQRRAPLELDADPEGAVAAPEGTFGVWRGGGTGQTFWVKETGDDGDTGWVAK